MQTRIYFLLFSNSNRRYNQSTLLSPKWKRKKLHFRAGFVVSIPLKLQEQRPYHRFFRNSEETRIWFVANGCGVCLVRFAVTGKWPRSKGRLRGNQNTVNSSIMYEWVRRSVGSWLLFTPASVNLSALRPENPSAR